MSAGFSYRSVCYPTRQESLDAFCSDHQSVTGWQCLACDADENNCYGWNSTTNSDEYYVAVPIPCEYAGGVEFGAASLLLLGLFAILASWRRIVSIFETSSS